MRLLWCRYTPVRPPQGLRLIQIPLHQRHEQRRRQPHQGHGQPAQSALHGAYLDGARRSDAVCGGSQRKSPRFGVPHRAEWTIGAAVCVLVLATDLRGAIGFSSFGVLLYYLVANLSALRQDKAYRRYPRALAGLGALGCLVIAVTVGWPSVLAGTAVLVIGLGYRWLRLRVRP